MRDGAECYGQRGDRALATGKFTLRGYRALADSLSSVARACADVFGLSHDRDRTQRDGDLVYYLDSLVPPEHWLSPRLALGEEARGWMSVRMGRMMGPGGMMHGMGSMPMMR